MKIRNATENDAELIKILHKQHKKEIGGFNLFWIWDKYLEGGTTYNYVVIEDIAFMRYGFSKKYKANVLYEIGVDINCTQRGAGRLLFNHLPKPTMLKCNQDNEIGNAFYLAMGMTKAGTTQTKAGVKQNIWWNS